MRDKSWHFFAIVLVFFVSSGSLANQDDFLSAIEAESQKLDSRSSVEEISPDDEAAAGVAEDAREELEKVLQGRYHGSFVFYNKLPERSRQEIVEEYKRGTSFEIVRKKIIDRFMQR